MEKAKGERSKKTNTTRKIVKEPSWINQELDSDEMTEEEVKAFKERLKNLE